MTPLHQLSDLTAYFCVVMKAADTELVIKHMGNPERVSVASEGEQISWERRVSMQGWVGSIPLSQPLRLLPQKASVH